MLDMWTYGVNNSIILNNYCHIRNSLMTAGEYTEFLTQLRSSHASLLLGGIDLSETHLQDT